MNLDKQFHWNVLETSCRMKIHSHTVAEFKKLSEKWTIQTIEIVALWKHLTALIVKEKVMLIYLHDDRDEND